MAPEKAANPDVLVWISRDDTEDVARCALSTFESTYKKQGYHLVDSETHERITPAAAKKEAAANG